MRRRLCLPALAVLAGILAAAASPAFAADPGLTVLSFLKLGVGARAASLGDAYVAVAGDATATYWNPAGLLGIEHNDAAGMHNEWIQDLRHEFVAVGARRGRHAFGVSFIGLYTDDIEARTEQGDFDGHYGYSDNAFSASYAFQLHPALGMGGTVRYVRESIVGTRDGDFTMDGFAFDLGGTWRTPVRGVTAAAVLRNLGGKLSFDNLEGAGRFDLPNAFQGGLAFRRPDPRGGVLTLSADVLAASGDDASLRVGAEYAYQERFFFGLGYKTALDNEDMSFGAGYEDGIRVHYAFTPIASDLGNSHRFSLGYSW